MMTQEHYPFQLKPLEYPYDALEPYIDKETMTLHHDKHLQAYVDNLNKALEKYPAYQGWSLERLLGNLGALPDSIRTAVRNNAGGVYNHNLFFSIMANKENKKPVGKLAEAIDERFGSYDKWKEAFASNAQSVFGSGWTWLLVSLRPETFGQLEIVSTQNQDVPSLDRWLPILLIDVWEHAYYLKYQNRRPEYIENWFQVINWERAEVEYQKFLIKNGLQQGVPENFIE